MRNKRIKGRCVNRHLLYPDNLQSIRQILINIFFQRRCCHRQRQINIHILTDTLNADWQGRPKRDLWMGVEPFRKECGDRCPPECPGKCGHYLKLRQHPEVSCLCVFNPHLCPDTNLLVTTMKVGATCCLLTATCYLSWPLIRYICYRPDTLSLITLHSLHITHSAIRTLSVSAIRYYTACYCPIVFLQQELFCNACMQMFPREYFIK